MAEVLVLSVSKVIREQPKFLASDGVVQQATADAAPSVTGMDNHVFQPRRATALGGADGEEQVGHAEDFEIRADDEDATSIWLFQNEAQSVLLAGAVRMKVLFRAEKAHGQFDQRIQIGQSGWFNTCEFGIDGGHGFRTVRAVTEGDCQGGREQSNGSHTRSNWKNAEKNPWRRVAFPIIRAMLWCRCRRPVTVLKGMS